MKVTETTVLVTSDTVAMYTNIDPEDGISTVRKYMKIYRSEVKTMVLINVIVKLLELIMGNNVFMFGETFWKQLVGTAMGTPCAINYTTIYFGWHERDKILPTFESSILVYGRLVDDIGMVWDTSGGHTLEEFDNVSNTRCKLKWITSKPGQVVSFLDVTVWIEGGRIWTKTFQKEMNLFQYITSNSAHPAALTKGLVCGLLENYWKQNSYKEDFIRTVSALFTGLRSRGHSREKLLPIFCWAAEKIKLKYKGELMVREKQGAITSTKAKSSFATNSKPFFHINHHPKDISCQKIQNIYEDTCVIPDKKRESLRNILTERDTRLKISGLTVAYLRPKNFSDCLVQSRLVETSKHNVEAILRELKDSSNKPKKQLKDNAKASSAINKLL